MDNITKQKNKSKNQIKILNFKYRSNYFCIVAVANDVYQKYANILQKYKKQLHSNNIDYDDNNYQNLIKEIQNNGMGFCQFIKEKDGCCFLNLVHVKSESRNLGVGSHLLKLMEKSATQMGCYYIEGKYMPESDANCVERFYQNNGYDIGHDGYQSMVEKSLILSNSKIANVDDLDFDL